MFSKKKIMMAFSNSISCLTHHVANFLTFNNNVLLYNAMMLIYIKFQPSVFVQVLQTICEWNISYYLSTATAGCIVTIAVINAPEICKEEKNENCIQNCHKTVHTIHCRIIRIWRGIAVRVIRRCIDSLPTTSRAHVIDRKSLHWRNTSIITTKSWKTTA